MDTEKTIYELSRDERALIYQHVQDVQNEVPGFGPLTVTVHKIADSQFELSFATQDGLNFETKGNGSSVFEASRMAKDALLAKLRLLINPVSNSPERAMQIFTILHGNQLH